MHLNDNLELTKQKNGFWLYDKSRGMNLSMRAKTELDACVEALEYYQNRLTEIEGVYYSLRKKVDAFNKVTSTEDD